MSGHNRTARLAGVLVALAFVIAALGTGQAAEAARTTALNESGHLRATSKHGFTLNERGSVSGTVTGTIYVHLTVVSTSRVSAEVNMYPSGGSISGHASASYKKGSQTGSFSGTMTITRGTGRYAGAHGVGLSFSGTIRRSDDAVTVRMSGTVAE
ncbi:MAG: hypothetical protein ACYDHN_09365 [Solirubrobacteraceae bacterium]